jgi:hypothetical protein
LIPASKAPQVDTRVEGARFQRLQNGGQGEGLMSPYTPGSVSPSLSLQRLKLKYDYLFSSFAFNYNLRPCGEVPSFDNKLAFDTLEEQLGGKWDEFYTELGPEPVAAASLGQVYKAGAYTRPLFSSTQPFLTQIHPKHPITTPKCPPYSNPTESAYVEPKSGRV